MIMGDHPNCVNECGSFPLKLATQYGNLDMVRLLLHHGAEVDMRGAGGATALMNAAWNGYSKIVRILIDAGADTSLRDAQGRTAWDRAALGGHSMDRVLMAMLTPRWKRAQRRMEINKHMIVVRM